VDTRPCNVLSICSGYGGIELGLHAALDGRTRTVCYVENELGVASILAARMEDGSLDPAPIWSDLHTFDPEPWRGKVDILAGGFPCQPHSVAGSQLGEDDPRELSGEVLRIADGLGLPDLFLENVPGILRFYWDSIRPQLREMGYRVAEGLFTASETGAPHKRERLFILADTDSSEAGRQIRHDSPVWPSEGQTSEPRPDQRGGELADTDDAGLQGWDECGDSARERAAGTSSPELGELPLFPPGPNDHAGWQWLLARWPELAPTYCKDGHDVQPEVPATESKLRGASHGTPTGVDRRLRAIGNGVVPIVAARAYRQLTKQLEGREE
jgi:DNA (cytosine-5)-methyltransferase 1